MPRFRIRDDESSLGNVFASLAIGALAGFAAGVVLSQKVGGLRGLTSRLRGRFDDDDQSASDAIDDQLGDDEDDIEGDPSIEERVLEAFRNDPVLSERAVDIGSVGVGVVELSGWVDSDDEIAHAATIARGTPGVDNVVNHLVVGDDVGGEDVEDVDTRDEERSRSRRGGSYRGASARGRGKSRRTSQFGTSPGETRLDPESDRR